MADGKAPADPIVLGYGGALGFAPNDQTSPARAADAEALVDTVPSPVEIAEPAGFVAPITELRIHGVSGSDGPTMLEHPQALQVAGDSVTMFYRRWTPAGPGGAGVPWKLEAYSWGGLTEAPLAAAAWVVLAPFMFYNVAHFMLPPSAARRIETVGAGRAQRLSRDRTHAAAQAMLRLLALAATLQFTSAVVSILVNTIALQAGAGHGHFPAWLGWYSTWTTAERVILAMAGVAGVLAAMWFVSVKTANLYEARSSRTDAELSETWPLTQSGFWKGQELVRRQRSLHAAAAAAATALILARPTHDLGTARLLVSAVSMVILVAVVVTLCLPVADRHNITLAEAPTRVAQNKKPEKATGGTHWCQTLLGVGVVVFVASSLTGSWPNERSSAPSTLPGFTNFAAILLGTQAVMLAVLGVVVLFLLRGSPRPAWDSGFSPFFCGHLTTLMATLAVCLGGVFGAVVNLFAARFVGTPVPSGGHLQSTTQYAVEIPWPIYAFALAPIGLVLGTIAVGVYLYAFRNAHVRRFADKTVIDEDGARSPVADDYGTAYGDPDDESYDRARNTIARAWADGLLVDQAAVVAGCVTAGMIIAAAAAETIALVASHRHVALPHTLHGFAAAESIVGLFLAGLLVGLLRTAYGNPSKRKTIGALWDVATFWPRATHPFAPPCYAERAVPELVDRIRILTGTVSRDQNDPARQQIQAHLRDADENPRLTVAPGPVLLTGYSQGSIIAPAVIAQLPHDTLDRVALLTLACPARRLYGRAFPGYFGQPQLDTLRDLMNATGRTGRWKNLVRRSDYIGSWIYRRPLPTLDPNQLANRIDQPCWDPVSLAANLDPTPPPIHRHSGWWQDPRVTRLGVHLAGLLSDRAAGIDARSDRLDPGQRGAALPSLVERRPAHQRRHRQDDQRDEEQPQGALDHEPEDARQCGHDHE